MNRKMLARFFKKVRLKPSGCWDWTAHRNPDGYGSFWLSEQQLNTTAHRVAFHWFVRPVDKSEVVDHLCRNTRCVNPAHLEAVSQSTNVARGLAGQERPFCKRGHVMTPENIVLQNNYGETFRTCRACRAIRETRRREKRRAIAQLGGDGVEVVTEIRVRRSA